MMYVIMADIFYAGSINLFSKCFRGLWFFFFLIVHFLNLHVLFFNMYIPP